MPKYERYQDYVFKDGRLVGEFEEMYRDFDNPWRQLHIESFASDKAVILNLLQRLRAAFGVARVLEIGCGLGQFTKRIHDLGLDSIGMDVSPTAIDKAKSLYSGPRFAQGDISDGGLISDLAPDVIVMCEVTWYVLEKLPGFLDTLRNRLPNAFLLHSLSTYAADEQKVGRDYFTTGDDIRRYFAMTYLEWGEVCLHNGQCRAYFLGTWDSARAAAWTYKETYKADDELY